MSKDTISTGLNPRHHVAEHSTKQMPTAGHEGLPPDIAEALAMILTRLDAIHEVLAGVAKSHYTVDEVARLVGRSAYTVRRWIGERRINASRIAETGPRGRLLIAREEVAKLIAEGKGDRVAFQLDNPSR
jgi:excisionase family DNA binding protein